MKSEEEILAMATKMAGAQQQQHLSEQQVYRVTS